MDVGLRLNHVNHCVLFFIFSYSFLPIIILCRDLHNKLESKLRLKISRIAKDYRAHKTKTKRILVESGVDCSLMVI